MHSKSTADVQLDSMSIAESKAALKSSVWVLKPLISTGIEYVAQWHASALEHLLPTKPNQINKCRLFLNSGSNNYSLTITEAQQLITLAKRFLVERTRRQTRYAHEQAESNGGHWSTYFSKGTVELLGPSPAVFSIWVVADERLQNNDRIKNHAQDILKSIREFMKLRRANNNEVESWEGHSVSPNLP